MKRDSPFDRLFRSAGKKWTKSAIDEFMEEVQRGMNTAHEPLPEYAGYRRTELDGEVTEEVYEDGEWKPLGEAQSNDETFEVSRTGDGYTLTLDVSGCLPLRDFKTSASLNDGVLEVTFDSADDE